MKLNLEEWVDTPDSELKGMSRMPEGEAKDDEY